MKREICKEIVANDGKKTVPERNGYGSVIIPYGFYNYHTQKARVCGENPHFLLWFMIDRRVLTAF